MTLGLLLTAGCSEAKTEKLLPWFRIKTIHYPSIGGFADARTLYESQVKRWGLWRKLENCQGGNVLNPDVVALSCSDSFNTGTALVRKGEALPRPACGSFASGAIIVPSKDSVDCFDVLAGRAPVVPTQLRMRRVDLEGRTLMSATLSADQSGRVFLGPIPRFYSADGTPHFVTYLERSQGGPECALLALHGDHLEPVAAAPELSVDQCYEARRWSPLTARALSDSLGREEAPAPVAPSRPQKLNVVVR
jgi:hypothetical protein